MVCFKSLFLIFAALLFTHAQCNVIREKVHSDEAAPEEAPGEGAETTSEEAHEAETEGSSNEEESNEAEEGSETEGSSEEGSQTHPRLKMIIDCDVGVDDAQALLLATSQQRVDILAITLVSGNVHIDKVARNTLRVLRAIGKLDIPVYKGATKNLLGNNYTWSHYHGEDGLGDPVGISEPDMSVLRDGHGVLQMQKIVRENPGQVTVLALGPLTNVALACRMDPDFCTNVKELHVMGGNYRGIGNDFLSAEFNFGADPEAAYVVLNEMKSPITQITWEFCLDHPMSWEFFRNYTNVESERGRFLKRITTHLKEFEGGGPYITADPFSLAVAIYPPIVEEAEMVHATEELQGKFTRGQMVVDWRGKLHKPSNVRLIKKINMESFKSMMMRSVQ